MASPGYKLHLLSLHNLQQNMQELAAMGGVGGWVRVSFVLSPDKGVAALSFHLLDRFGGGCLQGNIHLALGPQDTTPLFCWLLGRDNTWNLDQVASKRRGRLRLQVKRLDAAGLKQLILHVQAACN